MTLNTNIYRLLRNVSMKKHDNFNFKILTSINQLDRILLKQQLQKINKQFKSMNKISMIKAIFSDSK